MKEIRSVRALRKGSSKSGDPLVRRYPKLVMQYVKGKRPMIKAHFAALKEAFKKSIGIENYKEKDLNEYVAYHLTVIARDYYFSKKGDMPTKEILENLPKLFDKEFQPIIAKLRAELSKAKSFMEMWKPEVEGCKYEDFIKANTSKKTYASKSHRRLQALLKIGETEPAKVEAFKEQYCPAPKEDAALGAKGDDPATTGPELPNLKTGEGSGLAGLLKPGEIKVTMGRKEPRVVVDLSGGEEAGMDDGVGVEVVQARELNMKGCTDFVPHTNSGNDPVPMEHYDTCEFELSDGRSF